MLPKLYHLITAIYKSIPGIFPHKLKAGITYYIGMPAKPIPALVIKKIIASIKSFPQVVEIYHYAQYDTESRLMIGILAGELINKEKIRISKIINDCLLGLNLLLPVDITFLEKNSDYYEHIQTLKESLLYKK